LESNLIQKTSLMRIVDFDIDKGFYLSTISNIETEWHSHPAIELVYAKSGGLDVNTTNGYYRNVRLAIFDANSLHRIKVENCNTDVFLIEYRDYSVRSILQTYNIDISEGAFIVLNDDPIYEPETLVSDLTENSNFEGYDPRVVRAIEYIEKNDLVYTDLIRRLVNEVYLSESRLSHLFKKNTGISLKKYFVWSRLKKTVNSHLYKEFDLYTAMIHSGFYDQAHFSKSYKNMIGINPSKVYKKQNVTKD
jgi:AraC-like DNA-binding protein